MEANALLQAGFRASFFVGPLLLAPTRAFGLSSAYALDAATFVTSASSLALLRLRPLPPSTHSVSWLADLRQGLVTLRLLGDVRIVLVTFTLAIFFASGFMSVGLVALIGTSGAGAIAAGHYGLLIGISGCAEVIGALLLARLRMANLALAAVTGWIVLGAFRAPLGFTHTFALMAALLAVTGMASALTDIPLVSLVQRRVPARHLAKTLGLWESGIALAVSTSSLLAALVVDTLGPGRAFIGSGSALMALGLMAAVRLSRLAPTPPGELSTQEVRT